MTRKKWLRWALMVVVVMAVLGLGAAVALAADPPTVTGTLELSQTSLPLLENTSQTGTITENFRPGAAITILRPSNWPGGGSWTVGTTDVKPTDANSTSITWTPSSTGQYEARYTMTQKETDPDTQETTTTTYVATATFNVIDISVSVQDEGQNYRVQDTATMAVSMLGTPSNSSSLMYTWTRLKLGDDGLLVSGRTPQIVERRITRTSIAQTAPNNEEGVYQYTCYLLSPAGYPIAKSETKITFFKISTRVIRTGDTDAVTNRTTFAIGDQINIIVSISPEQALASAKYSCQIEPASKVQDLRSSLTTDQTNSPKCTFTATLTDADTNFTWRCTIDASPKDAQYTQTWPDVTGTFAVQVAPGTLTLSSGSPNAIWVKADRKNNPIVLTSSFTSTSIPESSLGITKREWYADGTLVLRAQVSTSGGESGGGSGGASREDTNTLYSTTDQGASLRINPAGGQLSTGPVNYYCVAYKTTQLGGAETRDIEVGRTGSQTITYYDGMLASTSTPAALVGQSDNPMVLRIIENGPSFPTGTQFRWNGLTSADPDPGYKTSTLVASPTVSEQADAISGIQDRELKVVPHDAGTRMYRCTAMTRDGVILAQVDVTNTLVFSATVKQSDDRKSLTVEYPDADGAVDDRQISRWEVSSGSTANNYSAIPSTSGLHTIDPDTSSTGAFMYRCVFRVNVDAVSGQNPFTIELPTDPCPVNFYSITATCSLSRGTTMWDTSAKVRLHASSEPPQATDSPYAYRWVVKSVPEGESSLTLNTIAGKGATLDLFSDEASHQPGAYVFECQLVESTAVDNIAATPVVKTDAKFVLYELGEPHYTENCTRPNTWLENGNTLDLSITVNPENEAILAGARYRWEYADQNAPGTWTLCDHNRNEKSEGEALQAVPVPDAGRYTYRCTLYTVDNEGTETILAQREIDDDIDVYGIRFEVMSGPNTIAENGSVHYGENFTITALARPNPGVVGNNIQANFEWSYRDKEANQYVTIQDGQSGYAITSDGKSSTLSVSHPSVGRIAFQCRMTMNVGGDLGTVTLTGDRQVNVWYNVTIEGDIVNPVGGEQVPLKAVITPEPTETEAAQIVYTWSGNPPGSNIPNTNSPDALLTIRGGTQTITCTLSMADGDPVGEATRTVEADYRVNINSVPSAGMAEAKTGNQIALTAVPDNPKDTLEYLWQVRTTASEGGELTWTDWPIKDSSIAVPVETPGEQDFRCLVKDGQEPTSTDYDGVGTQTVGAYALTAENSAGSETVPAGSNVKLTATLNPPAPNGTKYEWYVETDTSSSRKIANADRAQVTVTPEEGGSYTYTCIATLPGDQALEATTRAEVKQRSFRVTITTDPAGTSFPLDKPLVLVASVNSNPQDIVTYTWQSLTPSGWEDMSDRSDYKDSRITLLPQEEGETTYRCRTTVKDGTDANAEAVTADSPGITIRITDQGVNVDPGGSDWTGEGEQLENAMLPNQSFHISHTNPPYLVGDDMKAGANKTAGSVLAGFRVGADQSVEIRDKSGRVRSATDPLCTGDVIYLLGPNQEILEQVTIVIQGDIIGNGQNSMSQLVALAQAYSNTRTLSGAYFEAADWNGNGRLELTDLVLHANHYRKSMDPSYA